MKPIVEDLFTKKYDLTELKQHCIEWFSYGKESIFPDGMKFNLIDQLEIKEPELTKIARYILEDRYLWKFNGRKETPFEMFTRVVNALNDTDIWKERFLKLLTNLYFLPNSPTLMNAGRNREAQLSACFVIPVEDSMEGIYKALMDQAITQKMGGGTGFSFSRLRSKGQEVSTTHGVASGVLSFMSLFDLSSEIVQQGGMRRGANMGVLNYNHPEIIDFIKAKDPENRKLTNFNISVGCSDTFMNAVINKEEIALIDPHTREIKQTLNAADLFEIIVNQTWRTGDPGLIFLDTINSNNVFANYKLIESTNPCGEEPLLPYGACNLGSINLEKIITNGVINYELLAQVAAVATRFLDDIIEINMYPLEENYDVVYNTRDIGLGVMGFAHMLMRLGVPYNSDNAIRIANNIMNTIQSSAVVTSNWLTIDEKRDKFGWWDKSIWADLQIPMRNANLTSIAPTGSISIIAGTSSGIEPVFALSYERRILFGSENETTYTEINPILFEKYSLTDDIIDAIKESGSIQHIDIFDEATKNVFKTSQEIPWQQHILIQATFQRHTSAGVSKTINMPSDATVDDIRGAFLMAYKHKCKGITIYRDKSKTLQVINTGTSSNINKGLPTIARGLTGRLKTNYGRIYVTLNFDKENIPREVFINIGKSGKDEHATAEAIGRLISLSLQHNINITEVIKQLKGIGGENLSFVKNMTILSIPDAIARLLELMLENNDSKTTDIEEDVCPICGTPLIKAEGCLQCPKCGYSKCD